MDRVAAGDEVLITGGGKPRMRPSPATPVPESIWPTPAPSTPLPLDRPPTPLRLTQLSEPLPVRQPP
jgi:antitoxin (DNA-binding transcriptional repressor) of toxin-antitoxin stability system